MATTWRDELRQHLDRINGAGGPPPRGVEIVIPAEALRVAGHDVFLAHAGQRNDSPFCGAASGTLEIGFTGAWEKHPQLRFIYRSQPPADFCSEEERALRRAEGGEVIGTTSGVDFGALP